MPDVGLFDSCFSEPSASMAGENIGRNPLHINWKRDELMPVTFYTDTRFEDASNASSRVKKIAWLIEPPSITDTHYYKAFKMEEQFDYVLSFYKEFTRRAGKWLYYPFGGSWIKPENWDLFDKTKTCSLFVSEKRRSIGHSFRADVMRVSRLMDIDVFGRNYNPVDSKTEGLRDYRYSIVIESIRCAGYFSEKIIDCMCQGTVPIYWGDPDIGERFDTDGIIQFNNMDELMDILVNVVSEDDYKKRFKALAENLMRCEDYMCAEDWIYDHYPYIFEGK